MVGAGERVGEAVAGWVGEAGRRRDSCWSAICKSWLFWSSFFIKSEITAEKMRSISL